MDSRWIQLNVGLGLKDQRHFRGRLDQNAFDRLVQPGERPLFIRLEQTFWMGEKNVVVRYPDLKPYYSRSALFHRDRILSFFPLHDEFVEANQAELRDDGVSSTISTDEIWVEALVVDGKTLEQQTFHGRMSRTDFRDLQSESYEPPFIHLKNVYWVKGDSSLEFDAEEHLEHGRSGERYFSTAMVWRLVPLDPSFIQKRVLSKLPKHSW